ncbi:MAG: hypothetical protein PHC35_06855 [Deltaproteobacteria bacterium]|jgi:hypothetical protein|nr:hypothetical protein [Deltaproteobacteria bacterium]
MAERKLSWREIDKRKDKSGPSGKGAKSRLEKALENPALKKYYLQEAEKLFSGSKDAEKERSHAELRELYGSPGFEDAALKYHELYGLPQDWSGLLMFLDLKDEPDIVIKAMELLVDMAAERNTLERNNLKAKLRFLGMTTEDTDIRDKANGYLRAM